MSQKQVARTPSRALTLHELEMTFSGVKQKPVGGMGPPRPMSSGAKTLAQLFSDMPPPKRNNITSVKKPTNSVQKTYLSTSKKQIHFRKTDHTIVRRALNFIATNPIEDVRVTHPNSKKITRQTLAPRLHQNDKSNLNGQTKMKTFTPMNKAKDINKSKIRKTVVPFSGDNSHNNPTAAHPNTHAYELRSRITTSESNNSTAPNNKIPMFTQYRNVNESFDISIQEEGSPQVNPVEPSILEPVQKSETNTVDSQLSDLLSDMMCRTELKSNQSDVTQKIRDIQDKIHENLQNSEKQMEFLTHVFDEVSKNKQILSTCIESNKQILNMTNDLLKILKNECGTVEKSGKKNKLISIPHSRSAVKRPLLEKLRRESLSSFVKPSTPPIKNDEMDDLLSFENLNLRSRTKNIQETNDCVDEKKENVAPLQNKINSPRNKTSPFPRRSVSRPLYEKFRRESMRASIIPSASLEAMGMDNLSFDKDSISSLKEKSSPFNRKSISRPLYEKYRRESLISQVKPNTSLENKDIDDLASNLKKENITPSPKKAKSPRRMNSPRSQQRKVDDLRKTVLKFTVESKKNILKSPTLPKTSSKSPASSSTTSKSQQIFKSLKESVQILKTPVGKGKKRISTNLAAETPNTKSMNITCNNIKRQLESLYDS